MSTNGVSRGYFAVGIWHPKTESNIGSLWRTANLMGAAFLFTIGRRYKRQSSDTMNTPVHVPLFHFETIDDLREHLPYGCQLVGVEMAKNAVDLSVFRHPLQACYLLGAEDHGLPEEIIVKCHRVVRLAGERSMNVAIAGSIVLYHREHLRAAVPA